MQNTFIITVFVGKYETLKLLFSLGAVGHRPPYTFPRHGRHIPISASTSSGNLCSSPVLSASQERMRSGMSRSVSSNSSGIGSMGYSDSASVGRLQKCECIS